ncbi:MAG TPA: HAMP domain-containing sensor histidine kinase [Candidatus Rubrimentiphilum sp.]|nr:HAMP domain-containing sensor histidine kinase [Candidatus Rubrimentiphilum sp.]
MGSATSSPAANGGVPLLVLRVPEFEHIAWREGKRAARRVERRAARAFAAASRRVLRRGDDRIHDRGRDIFAVLVAGPPRGTSRPNPSVCRAMLQRIASETAAETGLHVESGWTLVQPPFDLDAEIEIALERGARERERYEFFAAVGHELRTPLASIRGYLETLLDGEVDVSTSQRFLHTAQREALRMGRMIDGMFEFSLLDLSAGLNAMGACDVAEQLALACDAVAPLARARGMTVAPDADRGAAAAIDPDPCLQLLINLLENATKYGAKGGTIAIRVSARGEKVIITVEDDGPGIGAQERASVFDLSVRGKDAAPRRGAGIGLAIVKLIAERCGGSVSVTDSALGGARFDVTLPAQAEFSTGPS